MTHDTQLYTALEVADIVGVSAETVRRWAREGRIKVIVLPGGGMRFHRDTVDQLLRPQRAVAGV